MDEELCHFVQTPRIAGFRGTCRKRGAFCGRHENGSRSLALLSSVETAQIGYFFEKSAILAYGPILTNIFLMFQTPPYPSLPHRGWLCLGDWLGDPYEGSIEK